MEEIKVLVTQEQAKISFNFSEIKEQLLSIAEAYKTTEYTDDTIKDAKTDRATLNKLAKEIDDRRKAVKKEYNAPLDAFEKQVKELTAIIQEPIGLIDTKVKEYEQRVRQAKLEAIKAYWDSKVTLLEESIRELAWKKIYDERWTNATATKKAYVDGIDNGLQQIVNDLESIESFHSEYETQGIEAYKKSLQLSDAVNAMNQLQRQKEEILRKEQERLEAEAKKKAEEERRRITEEERRKLEAEYQAKLETEQKAIETVTEASVPSAEPAIHSNIVEKVNENVDKDAIIFKGSSNISEKALNESCYNIKIKRDAETLKQVEEFLKFAEIAYEVM